MFYLKSFVIILFVVFGITACLNSNTKPKRFAIADSKSYEASLFRQNCVICHGPEGDGRTLGDGKVVPSLREGELKFKTEGEIYKQISEGGNGMVPFRSQLTEREIRSLVNFVYGDVRGNNK
jgi:mono/diheme cytochrome c family protein